MLRACAAAGPAAREEFSINLRQAGQSRTVKVTVRSVGAEGSAGSQNLTTKFLTPYHIVLRPFRLILRDLGSDRIVLSFVFIYQVIIYFTIFLSFKCKYIHQSIRNLSLFISRLTICFIQHGDKLKLKFCCKLRPFQFFFSWIFFIQVEIYGNAYAELCCVDY